MLVLLLVAPARADVGVPLGTWAYNVNTYGLVDMVAVGDVEADGDADLVVANVFPGSGGTVRLFAGRSSGLPTDPAAFTLARDGWARYVAGGGDMTGDGRADLAVSDGSYANANRLRLLAGSGGGFATPPQDIFERDDDAIVGLVGTGDIDGDGKSDVAVATSAGWGLHKGTTGTLAATPTVTLTGLDVVPLGDLNGDGRADLALQHSDDSWSILRGRADMAVASDVVVTTTSRPVRCGDIDGDGFDDVWVADDGGTLFYGVAGGLGAGAAHTRTVLGGLGDTDGDGYDDIAVVVSGKSHLAHGSPTGPEVETREIWHTTDGRFFAMGDVNRDGLGDVGVLQLTYPNYIAVVWPGAVRVPDDTGTDDTGADDTGTTDDTGADDTGTDDTGPVADDTGPLDTGKPEDEAGGCGCAHGGTASGAGALGLLLVGLARRRR